MGGSLDSVVRNKPETINLLGGVQDVTHGMRGERRTRWFRFTSEEMRLLALGGEAPPGPLRTILQRDKDIQVGASNNPALKVRRRRSMPVYRVLSTTCTEGAVPKRMAGQDGVPASSKMTIRNLKSH